MLASYKKFLIIIMAYLEYYELQKSDDNKLRFEAFCNELSNIFNEISMDENFNRVFLLCVSILEDKAWNNARSMTQLISVLDAVSGIIIKKFNIVMISNNVSQYEGLDINKRCKVLIQSFFDRYDKADNDLIVVLKDEVEIFLDKADLFINIAFLNKCIEAGVTLDIFNYTKIFMEQKLERANGAKIENLVVGSSYAKVGILEKEMPGNTINIATDSIDLYYTREIINKVLKSAKSIKRIILPVAYYMMYVDLSYNSSDYADALLTKVYRPIFDDKDSWDEDSMELVKSNFLMHNLLNFPMIEKRVLNSRNVYLRDKQFHNELIGRPEFGLLLFDFKLVSEDKNNVIAKERCDQHNVSFNIDRVEKNVKILQELLSMLDERNIEVLLFVPPVTEFYRVYISEGMINDYYMRFVSLFKQHRNCRFIDLIGSDLFIEKDFIDYDHLNDEGAHKLTKYISDLCQNNNE